MRSYKLLIVIFIIICSCSKNNSDLVDVESFLNEGKKISLINQVNIINENVNVKKRINISKFHNYNSWNQENYNSRNFIYPADIRFTKKIKSLSGKFQNLLIYKNKLVAIKSNSEITIYTKDFKKIISKKIYKRKVRKNYNLKFESILHNNKLFLSDNLGNLHSIDLKNLKILWKKKLGVPFVSNIKIFQNNIYVINSNSKIFSIDTLNGNLNWSFETASSNLKNSYSYQIAIFKNNIVFTNDSGEIYCLDLTKKNIKWSLVFESQIFARSPIIFESSPIVISDVGNLYVSSNYGYTYSIDIETGRINWSIPLTSLRRLVIHGNNLFIIKKNRFLILNKSEGTILYNKDFNLEKKANLVFKDILLGKSNIFLITANSVMIKLNYKNLNDYQRIKVPKKYDKFIVDKNNIFLKTDNSISKFE